MDTSNSNFTIAILLLFLLCFSLLLLSFYIYTFRKPGTHLDRPITPFSSSPTAEINRGRGLHECELSNIPAVHYEINGSDGARRCLCSVCLNEFEEREMVKMMPRCGHVFHVDCIDVWLASNARCPLCRGGISGRKRWQLDCNVAPNSSPVEDNGDNNFVVIDLGDEDIGDRGSDTCSRVNSQRKMQKEKRKNHLNHFSVMGDECINVKENHFAEIHPIRRSFSMDSAIDRHMYLQVRDIINQQAEHKVVGSSQVLQYVGNDDDTHEGSRGRIKQSGFFSSGHGRSSRNYEIL